MSETKIHIDGFGDHESANDAIQIIAAAISRETTGTAMSALEVLGSGDEVFGPIIEEVERRVDSGQIKVIGNEGIGPCDRTAEEAVQRAKDQHEMLVTFGELNNPIQALIQRLLGANFISRRIDKDGVRHEMTREKFSDLVELLNEPHAVAFLEEMMSFEPAVLVDERTATISAPVDVSAAEAGIESLTDDILIPDEDQPIEEALYDQRISVEMIRTLYEAYVRELERDEHQSNLVESFLWIICAVQWDDWEGLSDEAQRALLDLHLINKLQTYWLYHGQIEARDLFDIVGLLSANEEGTSLLAEIKLGGMNVLRKIAEVAKRYGELVKSSDLRGIDELEAGNVINLVSKVSLGDLQEKEVNWKLVLTDTFRTAASHFEDYEL